MKHPRCDVRLLPVGYSIFSPLTCGSVIASKSQESDFASVAKNVSQQVAEYNKSLIDVLQNNRS